MASDMDESSTLASNVEFQRLELTEMEAGCPHMAYPLELFTMPPVVLVYNDADVPAEFHICWRHSKTPKDSRLWCVPCYLRHTQAYNASVKQARIGPICFSLLTHADHLGQIPYTFANLIRAMPAQTSETSEFYNSQSDIGRVSLLCHLAALTSVTRFWVADPNAYLSSVMTVHACWRNMLPRSWKRLVGNFLHAILSTIVKQKRWDHLPDSVALLREMVKASRSY